MRNKRIVFILGVVALVVSGAAEELLPKPLGVGFPLLLASVQHFAARREVAFGVLYALTAGATEEALCSLPPMTAASYFLAMALLAHYTHLPRLAIALTYPCYQLWLNMWASASVTGVFNRVLLAVPVGLLTAFALALALTALEGKAGVDDAE